MTEVLVDAVADTLAECEAKKQRDTLADLMAEPPLYAICDTVAEVQP